MSDNLTPISSDIKSAQNNLDFSQALQELTNYVASQQYLIDNNIRNDFSSDEEYLNYIKKFEGTEWYEQLLNNSGLVSKNAAFSPNFWQQIGEAFGDTSARDAYYQSLHAKRNENLSEILSQMRQQARNEPSNQVALERAAGLNPDLGHSLGTGTATENDQASNPVLMNNSDSGVVPELLNLGTQLVSYAFQFYSAFQGMQSVDLDNTLKAFSLSENASNIAWDVIKSGTSEYLNGNGDSPGTMQEVLFDKKTGKMFSPIVDSFQKRVHSLPLSRKQKKYVSNLIDSLVFTRDSDGTSQFSARYQTLVNDTLSEMHRSRFDFAKSYGELGADKENLQALRFMSNNIYRPLNEMLLDVMTYQTANNRLYERTNWNNKNSVFRSDSEKAGYELNIGMRDVKNRVLNSFKEINRKITGSNELSPVWKLALQSASASLEAYAISKVLKF